MQAECSRRGLAQSAKWLAEISFAIRSTQQGQDSLPQPEMGPGDWDTPHCLEYICIFP